MEYLVFLLVMISINAHALKPAETFGIKLVPEIFAEKLMDCDYLGEVATRSFWGGLVAGSLGKKGVMKRLYRKANRLRATHIMLVESAGTAYSGFTEGSAHAFDCSNAGVDPGGITVNEIAKMKINQPEASGPPESDSNGGSQLRAVNAEGKEGCQVLKSIMKGAGGSGDPSIYMEKAMEKALNEATEVGADSYFIIDVDTTASGASVMLEALTCN